MKRSDMEQMGNLASGILKESLDVAMKPKLAHKGDLYKRAGELEHKILQLRDKMEDDIEKLKGHSKYDHYTQEAEQWLSAYENMIGSIFDFVTTFSLPDESMHHEPEMDDMPIDDEPVEL
jgi:hypothetical protein